MPPTADDPLDTLPLAEGVHAVRSSDGVVFLDIERDAYFCLLDPARTGSPDDNSPTLASIRAQLVEQGLVADGVRLAARVMPRPTTRLWRENPALARPAPGIRDLGYFLRALVRTTWRFRRSSLGQMIAQARRCDACTPQTTPAIAAARFEHLCLWLPFPIQCLFRSFFLLHFLHYYGLRADWIFGVSLFPFHAHCWLADGDLLLTERVGKVEGFVTIFQVERASA